MPEVMPEVKEKTKKLAQSPAGKKQMPAAGTSTGPAAGKLEARKAMEDARLKRTSAKRQGSSAPQPRDNRLPKGLPLP